ncbi:flippase [Proteus mirabilis]|uniref:Wzx n=2 Tax=Proteus mirabilis TaxID=584 RepID=A0A385JMW6_PROMI|nr:MULTISPECIES: flippase [Proteus]SVJ49245.1 Polysaccharide biosynthesis protein [Klebsiella pneumoniae]AXY99628.1 wzx [Proteus mirabilis]MCL8602503.1 flippase [Proteus mirabilis]MCW9697256.1 flippase [Proteus mirabilis]MDC9754739.1 flippase [Proteus mirabilis]
MNKKILHNAIWMISEKAISIIGLFLVTSYVAKYVGPETFGIIALATATFQIVQIIAQLGNDNIIFKRVSKNNRSGIKLIKSTFLIRTIIYITITIPLLIYFYSYKNNLTFIFSIAISVACYFSSIDVYSIYNNAILKSKQNTISNMVGLTLGLSIQFIIAYKKYNPIYLSIPIIITTFLPFLIRFILFNKMNLVKEIVVKKKSRYNKYILSSGLAIVFSSLSIAIYTRINQFMISYLDSDYSLGIYSVAVTLSSSWAFILSALISSTLPSIFGEKDDNKAIRIGVKLNIIITLISLLVLSFITLFGKLFINLLFGEEYINAYYLLKILCISTMFSNLGMLSSRFIVRSSGYSFLSKKMFIMVLLSIPISYCLIKNYGLIGASYSVLIIEFVSLTLMNYFFKKRIVWKLHLETLKMNLK